MIMPVHTVLRLTGALSFMLSAVIASASNSPASAASERHEFSYTVQWSNFMLAESVAIWEFDDDRLEMSGRVTPKGSVGGWSDGFGEVVLTARRTEAGWQAEQLDMNSQEGDEIRQATSLWSEATDEVVTTRTPEPEAEIYHPITPDMQRNVTAPFLAMVDMLDRLDAGGSCDGSFQIYDGWRRSQLRFIDKGRAVLKKDRPEGFSGEVRVCQLEITPIGGHRIKSRLGRTKKSYDNVTAYVGRHNESGRLVPVRIEVDVMLGRVIARLAM